MTETYASLLDLYGRGPNASYVQAQRTAGSAPIRMLRAGRPAGPYLDAPTPDLIIAVLTKSNCPAEADVGAGRWRGRGRAGDIVLIPPNTAGNFLFGEPHEVLALGVSFDAIRPVLDEVLSSVTDFGRLHSAPFRDPFVEELCGRTWTEAKDGSALGSLFADGAVLALVAALLRLSDQAQAPPVVARGGIAPHRLKRVLDCVEARLGDDISMGELAAAAELSPLYFARAFRIETGVTPHRHLLERRVERAKDMLTATTLTVAEVAVGCGFCDQSHLARWFKRIVGVTPSAYRGAR